MPSTLVQSSRNLKEDMHHTMPKHTPYQDCSLAPQVFVLMTLCMYFCDMM